MAPARRKEEFVAGNFLHHEIQKRIIGIFDVAYTDEDGLSELVDAAKDALKGMGVVKEKALMDEFLRRGQRCKQCCLWGREHKEKSRTRRSRHPSPLGEPSKIPAPDKMPELRFHR